MPCKHLQQRLLMKTTKEFDLNTILHILRNPHGWSENDVRKARLEAADRLEKVNKIVCSTVVCDARSS